MLVADLVIRFVLTTVLLSTKNSEALPPFASNNRSDSVEHTSTEEVETTKSNLNDGQSFSRLQKTDDTFLLAAANQLVRSAQHVTEPPPARPVPNVFAVPEEQPFVTNITTEPSSSVNNANRTRPRPNTKTTWLCREPDACCHGAPCPGRNTPVPPDTQQGSINNVYNRQFGQDNAPTHQENGSLVAANKDISLSDKKALAALLASVSKKSIRMLEEGTKRQTKAMFFHKKDVSADVSSEEMIAENRRQEQAGNSSLGKAVERKSGCNLVLLHNKVSH